METKADIANTSTQANNIILFFSLHDERERARVSKVSNEVSYLYISFRYKTTKNIFLITFPLK